MSTRTNFLLFLSLQMVLTACGQRSLESSSAGKPLNHLAEAQSPYLREHADNPVDWYEWGPEALEKAKRENKPLIISIGYSSCHWCHVMEEESFMDTAVARIMNENFVSIKIDREERPDIDQIYLNAAQLISGNGGWPLNAFALPDGKPFYAATYFPKDQWIKTLQQIVDVYKTENANVVKQAEALTKGIQKQDLITSPPETRRKFDQKIYRDIFNRWSSFLDEKSGGIKGSPKFPMPVIWEFLLQYQYLTGSKKALAMVTTTLDNMAQGGIYDQLGGGFARYSTDSQWKVPHFEKMLYDNGQLVSLYAHAYQVTKKPLYAEVIAETLEFIERELTSPEGGFYSSLNADSEGEEGKFYVWTKDEIKNILDNHSLEMFSNYYQVSDSGNWENGKNILYRRMARNEFARKNSITTNDWNQTLTEAHKKLMLNRSKRVRPSTDDKILTSWNALMLIGYTDAYVATGNLSYLKTALKNARFLEKKMIRNDGALWRNYKDGRAGIEGFLDDYALLAHAFIQLYQVTFDIHWLEKSRSLTDFAIEHFRDKKTGMFYYTSDLSEDLIARKMEIPDNVIPSSNSILAEVLFYLGEYYQENSYTGMSKVMLNQVFNDLSASSGLYYANWARHVGTLAYQPYEVAVLGEHALEKSIQLQKQYNPLAIFMGGEKEDLPLLENKYVEGKTIIYVCRNRVCKLPVQDVEKGLEQLK